MTDFKVGDRVRVRATPAMRSCAGKRGQITSVTHDATGNTLWYVVEMDSEHEANFIFHQHELEPEPSSPP